MSLRTGRPRPGTYALEFAPRTLHDDQARSHRAATANLCANWDTRAAGSPAPRLLLRFLFRCCNRLVGFLHRILNGSLDAGRISFDGIRVELLELPAYLRGTGLDALL